MKIFAVLRVAARALRRNKLRTILTMLGLIIGVGAVIATVSLGNGAKAQVEAQIASLGRNVILIYSGSFTRGGVRSGWNNAGTMSVDDAKAIEREISDVSGVSPEIQSFTQVASGNQNWYTSIRGESEGYLEIRQWPLEDGAMFTAQDVRREAKVAVIGKTVADELYPETSPIGQVMRIKNVPFVIVGELIPKGLSVMGNDQDDVVVVPYTSAMKRLFGGSNIRGMVAQAADASVMRNAQQEIIELLRQRHRITPDHEDDFVVRTQEEILEAADSTSQTMRVLLAGIACVSLLVGGIGIMNIMLVSVTERTREIGIRMAVGAHGKDILMQFLTEAVALSAIGGMLGVLAGVGGARMFASLKHWPALTPVDWICYAFLGSALVGIFFGFYPAWKASKLDPIEALRYE